MAHFRSTRGLRRSLLQGLTLASALGLGCQTALEPTSLQGEASAQNDVRIVYQRAESDRAALLERELERLRDDLHEAEQALVAVESGMRSNLSRADAVATIAGARIHLERARTRAPWQQAALAEAEGKLGEAERQTEQGHLGAALFFAARAERIALRALEEARIAEAEPGARSVGGRSVNLRQGPSMDHQVLSVLSGGTPVFPEQHRHGWVLVRTPSGAVGWIHGTLVQ